MAGRFAGKAVLVTGGGSGIGLATAEAFAAEGAAVAVAGVSPDRAERAAASIRATGGNAVAVHADVREPAAVAAMVEAAMENLGPLDILINSAGYREITPFLEISFADWQMVLGINLTGTFLVSQTFAKSLVALKRPGAIVNVTSTAGLTAIPNRPAYVAAKHGVSGLTKEMALDLAVHGIRVNAVAPGVIRTPMTEAYFDDPTMMAAVSFTHALGRAGTAEETAAAILFLASPEASFVTGAILPVDGGFSAGKRFR